MTAVSNCKKCPRNDKGIKSTYDSSAFTGWMKENPCRNDLAEAGKQCRGSMKRDAAICFHHQDRKTKQIRQSSCDCLRKYDGGGERARGLVGAEVVKPTYTQFIQRFQLTLIIAVDESARFLHLSNFCGRSYMLLREWEWARSWAESFCGILFSYKVRRDSKTCSRANWRGRLRLDFMPPYNAQSKPESCWPFRVHPNRY